jgi:Putative adhesin
MNTSVSTVIEHEVGPTGLVAIRLHSSAVRLRGVDGSTARIADQTGTLERSARIERGPGSLSIRAGHVDRSFSIGVASVDIVAGRRVPDLEVEVPREATVVIETTSGDISVVGLTGDQRYRTASGEIDLHDVAGQVALDGVSGDVAMLTAGPSSIAARTVSGDLRIRGDQTLAASRIATTSGDVWLEGRFSGPGPFSIETVSGDTILAPTGGVRLEVRTVTGDVRSAVPATAEGGRGSRTLVVREGGATLTIRSLSGDVRVVEPSRAGGAAIPMEAAMTPSSPIAPEPPLPPTPPAPPDPPQVALLDERYVDAPAPVTGSTVGLTDSMAILQALERGEIDVEEASRRLEALEADRPEPAA